MVAAVIASIAVVPDTFGVAQSEPVATTLAAVVVAPIASGFGVMVALFWLDPLAYPCPVHALLPHRQGSLHRGGGVPCARRPARRGCWAVPRSAMLGGYIALFHTAAVDMIANFAIAITTGTVLMARLLRHYDAVVAGSGFLLVLMLNVGFPFAVQWLLHALGSDLRHSSRDTLTGLLIRRAFYQSAYALLLRRRDRPSYLGVAMIDLDNFKRLNDTRGHSRHRRQGSGRGGWRTSPCLVRRHR